MWIEFLRQFTFAVKHTTGESIRVVNALSRQSTLLTQMHNQVLSFDTFHKLYAIYPFFTSLLEDTVAGFCSDYHLHDKFLFNGH